MPVDPTQRLLVLLLPERLEAFEQRPLAEDLLRATGVVAVDPPQLSYGAQARLPETVGASIAGRQARRLNRRLPGVPRAVAIFHPAQYPLARGLLLELPQCELWYGRIDRPEAAAPDSRRRQRLEELHVMAAERASLFFTASEELQREELTAGRHPELVEPDGEHDPLWERLAAIRGIS